MMGNQEPTLSVVATSRNDDHGGNLLVRMQYFVDGLMAQCKRHAVTAEIILVEWNPPADRPPLAQALKWPDEMGPAYVRIITVPRERHANFKHAEKLPLYQMIAKNAGIRRARGKFILATNIDILFSDAVFAYMRNSLQPGRLYRADRCDVPPLLPAGSINTWLDYCERAFFRINAKGGTLVKQGDKWRRQQDPAQLPFRARMVRRVTRLVRRATRLVRRATRLVKRLSKEVYTCSLQIITERLVRRLTRLRLSFDHRERTAKSALRHAWRLYDRLLRRLKPLHTNGCGDFTLMAREDWLRLRGYPEWDMFSWHIDSVLLYQAQAMGIKEVDLPARMRIFHIEHAHGSGYTPEGADNLFSRLRAVGLPYLEYQDFLTLVNDMADTRRNGRPILYNLEEWGLADTVLREARPGASAGGASPELASAIPAPAIWGKNA